jgi:dTDP-glucose pyrophosphorylase
VIGILPAAGYARRLGSPSSSKELLPLYAPAGARAGIFPLPVCRCVVDAMRRAGIRRVHIVIRRGKEDIPAALGNGAAVGMQLDYQTIEGSRGPAETIDLAYSTTRGATVALGFPDVLFGPLNAFRTLLARLETSGADAVLGLFPTPGDGGLDRVCADEAGTVQRIELAPSTSSGYSTWCLAVWAPRFTDFLHSNIERADEDVDARNAVVPSTSSTKETGGDASEMIIGRTFQAAVQSGLRIAATHLPGAWFIDVGSPSGLTAARQRLFES